MLPALWSNTHPTQSAEREEGISPLTLVNKIPWGTPMDCSLWPERGPDWFCAHFSAEEHFLSQEMGTGQVSMIASVLIIICSRLHRVYGRQHALLYFQNRRKEVSSSSPLPSPSPPSPTPLLEGIRCCLLAGEDCPEPLQGGLVMLSVLAYIRQSPAGRPEE